MRDMVENASRNTILDIGRRYWQDRGVLDAEGRLITAQDAAPAVEGGKGEEDEEGMDMDMEMPEDNLNDISGGGGGGEGGGEEAGAKGEAEANEAESDTDSDDEPAAPGMGGPRSPVTPPRQPSRMPLPPSPIVAATPEGKEEVPMLSHSVRRAEPEPSLDDPEYQQRVAESLDLYFKRQKVSSPAPSPHCLE